MKGSLRGFPESIIQHLYEAAETYGLEANEDTIARLKACWLEKRDIFDTLIIEKGMKDIGFFDRNDERGALFLTYSGSLVSVGPLHEGMRRIEYTSIGFRGDVPPSLSGNSCSLSSDGEVDKHVTFRNAPIRQTSRIFRIALCPENLSADDQGDFLESTFSCVAESFAEKNQKAVAHRE